LPVYRCLKCAREVKLPRGSYYCKECGPTASMIEVSSHQEPIFNSFLRKQTMERLKEFRDERIERPLREFINEVCRDEGVPPPEVVVVPRGILLQITDAETDVATYIPSQELICITPGTTWMHTVVHEIGHHIYVRKMGIKRYIEERYEEFTRRVPAMAHKTEREARSFTIQALANPKYLAYWRNKVEPLFYPERRVIRYR